MADQQQPGPKTTDQLADRVEKIRRQIEERTAGQDLTPAERAFKEGLDGILDILDDLSHGIDAGTF